MQRRQFLTSTGFSWSSGASIAFGVWMACRHALRGATGAAGHVPRLGRETTIETFMRLRDFPDPDFDPSVELGRRGRCVMHCHNLTHENHAMMVTWNIVP